MTTNITFNTNSNKEILLYNKTLSDETGFSLEDETGAKQGTVKFFSTARRTSVYISRIDNFTRLHDKPLSGIGFSLMKMAISSTPSCRTTLTSVKDAVYFYWKLSFRPDPNFDRRGAASSLKKEFMLAK